MIPVVAARYVLEQFCEDRIRSVRARVGAVHRKEGDLTDPAPAAACCMDGWRADACKFRARTCHTPLTSYGWRQLQATAGKQADRAVAKGVQHQALLVQAEFSADTRLQSSCLRTPTQRRWRHWQRCCRWSQRCTCSNAPDHLFEDAKNITIISALNEIWHQSM